MAHTKQEAIEKIAKTLTDGGDATDVYEMCVKEGIFIITLSALEYHLWLESISSQEEEDGPGKGGLYDALAGHEQHLSPEGE